MSGSLYTVDASEWNLLLTSLKHDIYHKPEYVQLSAEEEQGTPLAFLYRSEEGIFLLPIMLRKIQSSLSGSPEPIFDAISPYGYPGPIASYSEGENTQEFFRGVADSLSTALRDRNVVSCFVRSHPILSCNAEDFAPFGTVIEHGRSVSFDLRGSQDEIWRQVRNNHRRDIKKSRKSGTTIRIDSDWSAYQDFVRIYRRTMDRHGASQGYYFSERYFEKLLAMLGDSLVLCVAEVDGVVISASLYSECNGIVQYMLSGTDDSAVFLHPLKSMLFYMQEWAQARGNSFLHLGGGLGGNENALFDFKAGFSHHFHEFWTCRQIVDPDKYQMLTGKREEAAGKAADDLTGVFPAYNRPMNVISDKNSN